METDLHKTIGRNIRRFRRLADMTQAQLGERLGVHQQAVQRYECGRAEMRASRFIEIASALRQPLEAFLYNDEQFNSAAQSRKEHTR